MSNQGYINPLHAERDRVPGPGGTAVFTWCKTWLTPDHPWIVDEARFLAIVEQEVEVEDNWTQGRPLCQECMRVMKATLEE